MTKLTPEKWLEVLAELIHDLEDIYTVLNILKSTDNPAHARIVAVAATQVQIAKALLKSEIEV